MLAIIGPTATGKTRRAVEAALAFNGEIISADSRQVYRGMDIGSGKDIEEYGSVPYHLIDVADAGTVYNLHRFLADSRAAIADISSRGRLPIVCGGTGMYVEALLRGLQLPEVPRNEQLRKTLEGKSLAELTDMLASMKKLHNTTDVDTCQRAIRAIEIQQYYLEHPELEAGTSVPVDDAVIVGIDIDRDTRRKRIEARFNQRLENGMIEEVKGLIDAGVDTDVLIRYGLEYRFITLYLLGELSREQMEEKLLTAIYQFAKRQMTWFRGMTTRGLAINWIPFDIPTDDFVARVADLLTHSA